VHDESSLAKKIYKPAILLIAPAVLIMLIIPLPMLVLDILIAANVLFALTFLIVVLHTREASDFSLLPTLLIIATTFSIAVSVAVTRSILIGGAELDGRLIRFVSFLFSGSWNIVDVYIGFAIFIIVFALFSIVITKGATRVAEIAARFTLDGMPIRLMAIEAEYNSGEINEEEAALRKAALQKKIDFFGDLDGSVKFLSGSVKVNIIIIGVIVVGGILIDTLLNGKSVNEAIVTYIPLAAGGGIFFMIPPFLLSIAAGCIVTREVQEC